MSNSLDNFTLLRSENVDNFVSADPVSFNEITRMLNKYALRNIAYTGSENIQISIIVSLTISGMRVVDGSSLTSLIGYL